jgi:hypothetical protein
MATARKTRADVAGLKKALQAYRERLKQAPEPVYDAAEVSKKIQRHIEDAELATNNK